eukprot:1091752-Prorocentrum_minimum.AAC.2
MTVKARVSGVSTLWRGSGGGLEGVWRGFKSARGLLLDGRGRREGDDIRRHSAGHHLWGN